MKYKVLVRREVTHETEIVVEADTEEAARQKALTVALSVVFDKRYPAEYLVLECERED